MEKRLPWRIAGGSFVLYLIFLQWSPTFEGLAAVVRLARWDWHINLAAPLHQIVTYPCRWLPASLQLFALNAMAAACAAAVLGLLARSVYLMPNHAMRLQQSGPLRKWNLWVPPVFAALICGLQLTFWENAVVGTLEMFDLLLFSWLVNQLLEYRQQRNPRRLAGFAFVYGLAIVNNYAMIALFPPFLVAYVWIVGAASFQWRLMLKVVGCGIAGLSLYLFLPAVFASSQPDEPTFVMLLRGQWEFQRSGLQSVPRHVFLITSLMSFLPLAFVGLASRPRRAKATALGHWVRGVGNVLVHFILLVVCIAAAFDSEFSPRHLVKGRVAALPLYYLGALAIGYFLEFFLSRLGSLTPARPDQAPSPFRVAARKSEIAGLCVAAGVTALVLAVKTFIHVSGDWPGGVREMSRAMADSLPAEGAVVLSDDLFQLYAVQYELFKKSTHDRYAFVHTGSLLSAEYHRHLGRTYPQRWPKFVRPPDLTVAVDAPNLANALLQLDQTSAIYYLHPSFGLFFEFFEARPAGMVYRMVRSPTHALGRPPMSKAEVEAQHSYLQQHLAAGIERIAKKVANRPAGSKIGVVSAEPMIEYLETSYSRVLNHFGVEAQRAGNREIAGLYFALALRTNPENVAAFINREHNVHLRSGKTEFPLHAMLKNRLDPYENHWETILKIHGPFDEPVSCHNMAKAFAESGHYREAGRELERVFFYSPDNRSAQLDHGMMCIRSGLPDQAEAAAAAYRQKYGKVSLDPREATELVRIQAWAQALRRNFAGAAELLRVAMKNPNDTVAWDALVEIYLRFGKKSEAVQMLEERLRSQPNDVTVLANYGGLKMRMGHLAEALETTNRALEIDPRYEDARFNRALICAATGRWDLAQQDFSFLLARTGAKRRIQCLFGLAGVYFQKSNHVDSLHSYKEYLNDFPAAQPPTAEVQTARSRVRILEARLEYERLAQPGFVIPGTGQLRH